MLELRTVQDDKHPSCFGNYHYVIEEIKFSKDLHNKKKYLFQGAFYNYLIGKVQGYTPENFYMVDKNGEKHPFLYAEYEEELLNAIKYINRIKNGDFVPIPEFDKCTDANWNEYTNQRAIEVEDISLIVDLSRGNAIDKARKNGINTVSQFANLSLKQIDKLYSKPNEKRAKTLLTNAQAINSGCHKVLNTFSHKLKTSNTYLFLDVEDTGYVHPSIPHFVFLIGVTVLEQNKVYFKSFVAFNEAQEGNITQNYIDFMKSFDNPTVFYWSPKERTEFKRIFQDLPSENYSFSDFEDHAVDMQSLLKDTVAFPIYRYSVKNVAKYLGFNWRQENVDGQESMILFWNVYQDQIIDQSDERIQKIITYNEDDCNAMLHIFNWMRENIPENLS